MLFVSHCPSRIAGRVTDQSRDTLTSDEKRWHGYSCLLHDIDRDRPMTHAIVVKQPGGPEVMNWESVTVGEPQKW